MNVAAVRIMPVLGLFVALACPPAQAMDFDKGELKKVKKAAIVSVVIDNLHTGEVAHEKFRASNGKFMDEAAAYARQRYQEEFTKAGFWELVPAPETAELDKAFADLPNSKTAMDALMKLATENRLPVQIPPSVMMQLAMAQMKGDAGTLQELKKKVVGSSAEQLQKTYEAAKAEFVWDKGLAFLPYAWAVKKKDDGSTDSVLRLVAETSLKEYCAKHGLDAAVVLYLRSSTAEPGKGLQAMTITTGKQADRAVTVIKVNPTVVVRTAGGGMAVDGETPRMDDLAPMKWVRGYHDGIIDGKKGFWIDLNDPDGIAMKDMKALIDSTSEDLVNKIAKKAKK